MMRFAIDANESPLVSKTWTPLFRPHEVIPVKDLGLHSLPDIELFSRLAEEKFDAIITRDRTQLAVEEERLALEQAGLTWIGHHEPSGKGIEPFTQLISSYCLAMPHILKLMEDRQTPLKFIVKNQPRTARQVLRAWEINKHPYTAI